MITARALIIVFLTLVHQQVLFVNGQYTDKPGGLLGIVQGVITTATDLMDNSFDTAEKCSYSLKSLLRNALYTLVNNPITRLTVGFRNRAVGSSLIMLRNAYVEAIDPVIDTVHEQMDQMGELREQIRRSQIFLKRSANELRNKGGGCLTPMIATDVTNDLLSCALIPIHNTIVELRKTQDEVRDVLAQLNMQVEGRQGCLTGNPKEAVVCTQTLVSEIPAFIEMINNRFASAPSLFEYMIPIVQCVQKVNGKIKMLCTNQK
ncbi:unnamed protein product [Hermetia illucens]|uniref:Secreted protein n=1 Tax=Hermetia illucens TaxID=343691 RepID=A0A7R8YNX4_HERIL|nr:uncharacterized protein LOC119661638 [Hermetia illucens]CAD7079711.1 unnamed protein product [Hermetia illucens]